MRLYVCYEGGVYEGSEWYFWADSDDEAVKRFKRQAKSFDWKGEYYVKVVQFQESQAKVVMNILPTKLIKIFKVK
jgi:hypothetical protein